MTTETPFVPPVPERVKTLRNRYLDQTVTERLGGTERGRVIAVDLDGLISVAWQRGRTTKHVDDELEIVRAPGSTDGFRARNGALPAMNGDPFSKIRGMLPKYNDDNTLADGAPSPGAREADRAEVPITRRR